MNILEKIIIFLMPNLFLKRTNWESIWEQNQKNDFILGIKVFFSLTFISYVLHYYTVDRIEGLSPSTLWFNYRFGMAAVSAIGYLIYSKEFLIHKKYYKVPALIACIIFCYFQTKTIIWYPKVPYLYSFAFILISVMILRLQVLASILFSTFILYLDWPLFIEAGLSPAMMGSASAVMIIFILLLKTKTVSEVKLFLANQRNLESQRRIIETNLEFTSQIKSFLPKEICNRLTYCIQEQRMTVPHSVEVILRPRKQQITCLFSDIRGFTKNVGDLDGYVSQSLLPNLKSSTAAVERFHGIPRKIGDLLLSYYDQDNQPENLVNVVRSAVEISFINKEMNDDLPQDIKIKRYILISSGEAIVGNLSGYDSNIEISAIGKPINLLSRIDELTKNKTLQDNLSDAEIILTPEMVEPLKNIFPGIEIITLPIESLNLKIRDFESIGDLYILPVSKKNNKIIFKDNFTLNFEKLEAG